MAETGKKTKREEWLDELRDHNINGVPSSGPYEPRQEVMREIAEACGLPFPLIAAQEKEDWRNAVEAYFDSTPTHGGEW